MTINQRIEELIFELKINKNRFADALGMNQNVIYNTIKGRNHPSYDLLEKIILTFHVSPTWLFLGKGDMFLEYIYYMDNSTLIEELDRLLKRLKISIENIEFLIEQINLKFDIQTIKSEDERLILETFENVIHDSLLNSIERNEQIYHKLKYAIDHIINRTIELLWLYNKCSKNTTIDPKEAFRNYLKVDKGIDIQFYKNF